MDIEHEAGIVDVTFQNIIVHGESPVEDTSYITFNGVIWNDVISESMPVIFIEPSNRNQNEYQNGDNLVASVQHPYGRKITQVEWFIGNTSVSIDTSAPFMHKLSDLQPDEYIVHAIAKDEDGETNKTAPKRIQIVSEMEK